MIVKNYINYTLPSLKTTDTVEDALDIMADFKLNSLALVSEGVVLAIISEKMIENLPQEMELGNLPLVHKEVLIFEASTPFFESLKLISDSDKDTAAVVDQDQMYLGTITKLDLFQKLVEGLSLHAEGGLIEIKLKDNTYSLSEISRLIEQEHAHILSMFLFNHDEVYKSILMKVDAPQISFIVHSLERFGYEVVSYFSTEHVGNLEKDRFDLLMKYLSI